MSQIIRDENSSVDDAKVNEKIEQIAAQYQDPQEVITWYNNNDQQKRQLESAVLEDQVIDLMMATAKIF